VRLRGGFIDKNWLHLRAAFRTLYFPIAGAQLLDRPRLGKNNSVFRTVILALPGDRL
jgi:hypothetical protein